MISSSPFILLPRSSSCRYLPAICKLRTLIIAHANNQYQVSKGIVGFLEERYPSDALALEICAEDEPSLEAGAAVFERVSAWEPLWTWLWKKVKSFVVGVAAVLAPVYTPLVLPKMSAIVPWIKKERDRPLVSIISV